MSKSPATASDNDSAQAPPASSARRFLRRLRPSRAALALVAVAAVVAVSCFDGKPLAELAEAHRRLDAALLARTARTLLRAATACALAAALAMVCIRRLRRPAPAFLLLALLLGPFYLFALTPFSSPDETFHYAQTLSRAAPLAGVESCDKSFALETLGRFLHRNRPEGYVFLGGGQAGAPEAEGETIRPAEWRRKGNAMLYLPQTAGVAAGLRAGLGPRGVFYLGRAAALCFYALFVFLAIRIAPAFRRSIAVVALCPIALQQAASYSYDCATLSAGFLCFALFLRLAAKRGRLSPRAVLPAFVAAGWGMAVKGAAAAFLPLLFAIPASRFRRRLVGKALFLLVAAVVAGSALAASLTILPGIVRDRPPDMLWNGQPTHVLSALLLDPCETARIFLRTFDFDAVQLFLDTFGSRMSGLTLRLPAHLTLAFVAAVFLSVRGDRRIRRSGALRAASLAGILILTLFLCFVMLLTETPAYAANVWDLQGRYWTVVLPALLCALFARDPSPDPAPSSVPDAAPSGLLFPALALLHLDVIVFLVRTTLAF